MGFDPFPAPLHRNKLTIGNAMTATPRAAPRPIVVPLRELDVLASGAQDSVRERPGDAPLEEEPGDLLVEVGKHTEVSRLRAGYRVSSRSKLYLNFRDTARRISLGKSGNVGGSCELQSCLAL